jgi:GNAT superfamily N-acetyltransferase
MAIHYSTSLDHVDWARLAEIFVDAALGDRSPALIEETFRNSQAVVFAWERERLIGAGRALSDHVAWSVIFDIAVDPSYQGRGIGAALVRGIASASPAPNLMLKAVPGKEAFYATLGFEMMPTGMERRDGLRVL